VYMYMYVQGFGWPRHWALLLAGCMIWLSCWMLRGTHCSLHLHSETGTLVCRGKEGGDTYRCMCTCTMYVYFIYHIGLGPWLYRDEHTHAHVQELQAWVIPADCDDL